ncbi:MAG: YitT family protein [Desulfobacterales bacterium]|jgi:uncharacterized membrane-anchored protein YitT (DUF2179 family)|nr:YitT family protein [Desulfobacterales bacterium]
MISTKGYRYNIPWNLFLITVGAVIFSLGLKAIAVPHGFITGGISGVCLLVYYATDIFSPGFWYFIVNIPLFLLGWIYVSKRFFYYSTFGMLISAAAIDLISIEIGIKDPILSALAGGAIMGTGAGIILHSLGSAGGADILAVILNQKFNLRMGAFFFFFNIIIFTFSLTVLDLDIMLYSLAQTFITAQTLDYVLSMFNQRKMVLIISDYSQQIADQVLEKIRHGATFLDGSGAYSGQPKKILLTVVNNHELKRVEEIVFTTDPDAFVIMENTFNVLGKRFSSPKVY